jgi:hypothetical protein
MAPKVPRRRPARQGDDDRRNLGQGRRCAKLDILSAFRAVLQHGGRWRMVQRRKSCCRLGWEQGTAWICQTPDERLPTYKSLSKELRVVTYCENRPSKFVIEAPLTTSYSMHAKILPSPTRRWLPIFRKKNLKCALHSQGWHSWFCTITSTARRQPARTCACPIRRDCCSKDWH